MKSIRSIGLVAVLAIVAAVFGAFARRAAAASDANWPLFALCMDTHDEKKRTLAQQAEMLKDLGYAGAGHLWLDKVAERIETLDKAGLKLFQIYMRLNVAPDAKQPDVDKLKDVLPLLKGRGVSLAVLINGAKPGDPAGQARAVELLRKIADEARPFGVSVALYPHVRNWLEKFDHAVDLAAEVDRPNVGVMFNLCHYLKTGDEKEIPALLKKAGPRLLAVTINGSPAGADVRAGKGTWITPLDECGFDMVGLLKTLREIGYKGPVGLQCYGIRGDAAGHLARSMKAWREMVKAAKSGR